MNVLSCRKGKKEAKNARNAIVMYLKCQVIKKQKELFLQEMEIRLQNVAMFQGSRKIEINVI